MFSILITYFFIWCYMLYRIYKSLIPKKQNNIDYKFIEDNLDTFEKINKIDKNLKNKLGLIEWKTNMINVIDELNFKNTLDTYDHVINDIKSDKNYYFWKCKNNVDTLFDYNIIIYDLQNLINQENLEINDNYIDFTKNLIKHGDKINKKIIILGDLHPNTFTNFLVKYNIDFDIKQYVSPFHYSNSFFGIKKELNDKGVNVSISKIIKDILKLYEADKNNLVYLGKHILDDYESILLS